MNEKKQGVVIQLPDDTRLSDEHLLTILKEGLQRARAGDQDMMVFTAQLKPALEIAGRLKEKGMEDFKVYRCGDGTPLLTPMALLQAVSEEEEILERAHEEGVALSMLRILTGHVNSLRVAWWETSKRLLESSGLL